jgi:hypothetical protein
MFKKIILAFMLGIFGTIYFAQYDAWTHKKIIQLMQKVARESLGGNFSGTIQSISFFSPSIVLQDVEMLPTDSVAWSWRCKKCEITCSWLQLLFKGTLDQHMTIDGFECTSRMQDAHLSLEPHLMAMMEQSFVPFSTELKSVIFKNGFFCADDQEAEVELMVWFNSSSLRIGKHIKTTMSIGDGEITHKKNKYIEKIGIDVSLVTTFIADALDANIQVAGTCVLSHMGNQGACYVSGVWNGDRARFAVRNAYNAVMVDPLIITEREIRAHGHFPLAYALQCMRNSLTDQAINGTAHFSVKMGRDALHKIDGQLVVEDVAINQFTLCDVGKIIFERHYDDWKMRLVLSRNSQECKGTGHWHQAECKGEISISNSTDLSTKAFNYWRIKHNHFFARITADQEAVQGNFQATATHTLSAVEHCVKGLLSCDYKTCNAQGSIDTDEFDGTVIVDPEIMLRNFSYKDKDKKDLVLLRSINATQQIHGSISFPFVRSILNNVLHYDLQGEGSLDIVAHIAMPEITADIALKDATIRLPQTYNFIDGFSAHCVYNATQKLLTGENIHLSLHTGKVSCLRATSYFDSQGLLQFMHAPFVLDRCLLNINKDLFAIVSGDLLFAKQNALPSQVSGHILIDKAQLKENLFSGIIQKQLLSYTHSVFAVPDVPLHCDLAVETKSAIRVDTGFFKTNAHVNLRVKKEDHEPAVTGSIVLHSGTLNFPYKPLYISTGIITFTPEQLFDPTIEFIARNKIKKYDVSLQIEGSLLTHHIALDATPPLSEEQIVGLLLVGSEENSLNAMMPALIVQNLKSLIFSNNQLSFFDKYFKPLLGSLHINLVPSFTDQTGRGGLRGVLEITVDDRWRAVIQKNFSLTEDTKFELEYLFSDDITFRAIRDERRDLGGEVEMRWKF